MGQRQAPKSAVAVSRLGRGLEEDEVVLFRKRLGLFGGDVPCPIQVCLVANEEDHLVQRRKTSKLVHITLGGS